MVLRGYTRESRSLPGLRRTEDNPAITKRRRRELTLAAFFVLRSPPSRLCYCFPGDGEPMSTTPSSADPFPYATHLNILFPQLEKIDVSALAKTVNDRWYNQTLCQVNGSVVRLGVMQ